MLIDWIYFAETSVGVRLLATPGVPIPQSEPLSLRLSAEGETRAVSINAWSIAENPAWAAR